MVKQAFACSLLWCLAAALLATLAEASLPEHAKEQVEEVILFPLPLITSGIVALIDAFGSTGQAEPASSYLSVGGVRVLTVLSFLLYFALVFSVAVLLVPARWRDLHPRSGKPQGGAEPHEQDADIV